MSSAAIKWAKRQKIEDATLRSVLAVLAENEKGGACSLTQERLASAAGLRARAVRTALSVLEQFAVINRQRDSKWSKRGRSADVVTLSIDQEFTLTKDMVMAKRRLGPTGTKCRMIGRDQPARDAGAPTPENAPSHIEVRTRGVLSPASPSNPPLGVSVSTRVRFDRQRDSWRASLTVDGVTMELGRFDTEAEADAYAAQAIADIRRTSTMKAGTPSFPVVSPSKANLDAPSLGAWLFGDEDEETADNGVGAAGASGQGAKLLAGLGGAHESTEYDAARAGATVVPFRGRAA